MYGGGDAVEAGVGGKYVELGVHTIEPMIRRGVLLDVPGALGLERCEGGYEITVADLEAARRSQGTAVARATSCWCAAAGAAASPRAPPTSASEPACPASARPAPSGSPSAGVHAVGADTIAFERLAPGGGHALLPAHRVLLVEHGIYIIEALDLEELAAAGVHEFTFVLVPLNIYGATGSPVRPLAVVSA